MWQGQNRKNHQVLAAHIPALLHPDPKSVLVIGLGTGQTARSFLLHDLESPGLCGNRGRARGPRGAAFRLGLDATIHASR